MPPDNIAIEVHNLSKCYAIYDKPIDRLKRAVIPRFQQVLGLAPRDYYREFWALRDVSFSVERGSTVGIIGRNGSGKSTLLQLICNTLMPSSGSIETRGRIAALLELGSGFNPEFSGRENVFLYATVLGLSEEEINHKFDEIADFANIGDFIDQPVKTYSSGMVVRLAFAVSACIEPEILIVDEALSVGDIAFQFKCLSRLEELTKNGTTLLFVSHDMTMVKNFCHSAIYLHHGEIRASGDPALVAEQYFMDMREQQLRNVADESSRVIKKTARGRTEGVAFGTAEGDILQAAFTDHESPYANFLRKDNVAFKVSVRFRGTLSKPALSVIVQDIHNITLGGNFFYISDFSTQGDWSLAEIDVSFPAHFSAGRYFVTLRLEQRESAARFIPIDKQAGMLSFDVMEPEADFIGPLDLNIQISHTGTS